MNKKEQVRPNLLNRKYLVNKEFQFSFISRMSAIIAGVCISLYLATQVVFYRFNLLGKKLELPSDHDYYQFIVEQSKYMGLAFFSVGITAIALIAIYSLFLSHRIAGPLENIKNCFKKVEDAILKKNWENIKQTSFRKDDFFHEFAEAYNEHLVHLKENSTADMEKEEESHPPLKLVA